MHEIEPHYGWRHLYTAEEDERSPFHGREYSEFEFTHTIYNYYIHPQWDDFGSSTLYMKILFADYDEGFCIIELLGEWNDLLYNDVMFMKRDIADELMHHGIDKFILIAENVLNFHGDDESYYEEWFEDAPDGWIAILNLRDHVKEEMRRSRVDYYFVSGGELQEVAWRTLQPQVLYQQISKVLQNRLGM